MANVDEARELVKRIVRERLVEKVGVSNIVYRGEEVHVTIEGDGGMRFRLPRLKKAYVAMSGRVYERQYAEEDNGRVVQIGDAQPAVAKQLGYDGEEEEVDTAAFSCRVICPCGGVRYVKKQDVFQVTKCKPCTVRERRERRRRKARRGSGG